MYADIQVSRHPGNDYPLMHFINVRSPQNLVLVTQNASMHTYIHTYIHTAMHAYIQASRHPGNDYPFIHFIHVRSPCYAYVTAGGWGGKTTIVIKRYRTKTPSQW